MTNICIGFLDLQGSADSNYSQPSSDLSLDEEKETLRREKERQALNQLDKARVSEAKASAQRVLCNYMLCVDLFADQTSSLCSTY